MKRSLIVNADDFGRTVEINQGIFKTYKCGIVTSVSLMANFDAFQDAVKLIKQYGLPVGIHFNLTEGRPLSHPSQVPSLLDSNGFFFRKFSFYRRLLTGGFQRDDIRLELKAQLGKCLDYGLMLDHYDGHHHIHALRDIAPLVRSLGYEIKRLPFRRISRPHFTQSLNAKLQQSAIHLFEEKSMRAFPTKFWGIDFMDRDNKYLQLAKILNNLTPGFNELMCHPGFASSKDVGYYNAQRRQEVDALCESSIKKIIHDRNIKLISYQEFTSAVPAE